MQINKNQWLYMYILMPYVCPWVSLPALVCCHLIFFPNLLKKKWNLPVDIPWSGPSCPLFLGWIGILSVGFYGGGKWWTWRKTHVAKMRSNNKNSTHMWYQAQEWHHLLCFYLQNNTWVYVDMEQHMWINIVFFHTGCNIFSLGWKSMYNTIVIW